MQFEGAPAEELPLNEGHRHAGASQSPGKRRSSLARAGNDRVEFFQRM
jgi:hypothetical protein